MSPRHVSRRSFLAGAGAFAGAALWTPSLWSPARARALGRTIASPAGTTLEASIVRAATAGYSALTDGPAWPTITRADLTAPSAGREDRREALAAVVHLTDIHVIDAQSPGRVEFLDRHGEPLTAGFRPQETLTTHVGSSMVQRINALAAGPITGRRFDCAVSTGDNIDNQQTNEAEWFVRVLDGGRLDPNSGAPGVFEGVQDASDSDAHYWHPDEGVGDDWKTTAGYPSMPGLLAAAIAAYETPALACRWYSTYGNHDGLVQGNLPRNEIVDQLLGHHRKILDVKPSQSPAAFIGTMFTKPAEMLADLEAGTYPFREVTADASRRTITGRQWVQLHLDSPATPGPVGHGYTQDHLELPAIYYDFPIAEGVLGISLDTGGFNSGSIGQTQMDWLERTLRNVHSRHFDSVGTEVSTGNTDQLVVIFSHYNRGSMNQPMHDPANPDEHRFLGDDVVAMLHRFPNVVAWVNGHHHTNSVTPVPDPTGRGVGFWDINTASHVDYPQHARIVEIVDNRDGTLSLFSTMIEHLAPAAADPSDISVLGLAAVSRELSANDPQSDRAARLGAPSDLNVELVIANPLRRPRAQAAPAPAVAAAVSYTG